MTAEDRLADLLHTPHQFKDSAVGRYRIHSITAGHGPVLLLLHGANIGWGMWYKMIPELAKRYTVIAVDLPGAGRSTKLPLPSSFEEYVEMVETFVRGERIEPLSVVGHSFGGWVALRLGQRQRISIKHLVAIDPVGLGRRLAVSQRLLSIPGMARLLSATVFRPDRTHMKNFLQSACVKKKAIEEEFIDYFYEAVRAGSLSHPIRYMKRMVEAGRLNRELLLAPARFGALPPVLLLWGEQDPLVPWQYAKKNLHVFSHLSVQVFKNTGHVPPLEAAVPCTQVITSFIQSHQ